MLNTGMAPWPFYADDEIAAATQCLLTGKVNQWTGHQVKEFEKEFAAYVGTKHAVAVSNGTVALDLIFHAYMGNGLEPGDEVIVTSRTFLASVSSIINADLKPVFADVDRNTGNISPETIKAKINHRTKAIVCVHLGGWPCDMPEIMNIAKEHGLLVIEDCAQAHGAEINGQKVGSFGHASAWSFCQDKIISTGGEGGMITTNSEQLWREIWEYKDHGKSLDLINKEHPPGFRWVHASFGSNYRMTEIQAAIGRVQLTKLDMWVDKRNFVADLLNEAAYGYSAVRLEQVPLTIRHAKYKHYMYVNPEGLNEGWSRDRIIKELGELGTPCYQGSCSEVYLEPAFSNWVITRLPVAKELGETSLMFLVHPTLGGKDWYEMCSNLERVLDKASKTKCKM